MPRSTADNPRAGSYTVLTGRGYMIRTAANMMLTGGGMTKAAFFGAARGGSRRPVQETFKEAVMEAAVPGLVLAVAFFTFPLDHATPNCLSARRIRAARASAVSAQSASVRRGAQGVHAGCAASA